LHTELQKWQNEVKVLKDQMSDTVGKKEEAGTKIEEYIVGVSVIFVRPSNT